jgi:hypothetical protein
MGLVIQKQTVEIKYYIYVHIFITKPMQHHCGGLSYPVQCIIITGMTFIADNQITLQS